jgi:FtsZ-binding cell division protein ZapB
MATKPHASKRVAQNSNNENLCTPTKAVKSKIPKPNTPVMQLNEKEEEKRSKMKEIYDMFKTVMKKLEKLDNIEADMKVFRKSLDYAHEEIADLKNANKTMKVVQAKAAERIEKLERDNNTLRDKVVDIQARSKHENLLFFNMPESEGENTTEMIHHLLESKMEVEDARNKVKIDRSHRIGKKKTGNNRPRLIVVKFNYHQDRDLCE